MRIAEAARMEGASDGQRGRGALGAITEDSVVELVTGGIGSSMAQPASRRTGRAIRKRGLGITIP
jgi:hypothetical protein